MVHTTCILWAVYVFPGRKLWAYSCIFNNGCSNYFYNSSFCSHCRPLLFQNKNHKTEHSRNSNFICRCSDNHTWERLKPKCPSIWNSTGFYGCICSHWVYCCAKKNACTLQHSINNHISKFYRGVLFFTTISYFRPEVY